ncbi:MAG: bifunctional 4-hydroxy-2-oxoglutarate aldolase/2-dehydro-3-deoxy-phosphogluconate aldolase [Chloroflexia bacterium]
MNEAGVLDRKLLNEEAMRAAALAHLRSVRVVGVVRVDDAGAARQAAQAFIRGGLGCVEITLTTPEATAIITELADRYRDDPSVLIGAGTVLTRDQARAALDAGARFLVAPVAPDIAPVARDYGAATILGALTPTEILAALDKGSDIVKVFPVSAVGGPGYFNDIFGPLAGLPLWAAGGTTIAAVGDYLRAGVQVVGLAGSVLPAAAVRAGDWAAVEELARRAAVAGDLTRSAVTPRAARTAR